MRRFRNPLTPRVVKELAKYTPVKEIHFYRREVGYFPPHFYEGLCQIQENINGQFKGLENDIILALIISEMISGKDSIARAKHSMEETHPYMIEGSRFFLKALEKVKFNPYNVDSVTFKFRKMEKFRTRDLRRKKLSEIRKAAPRQDTAILRGVLPILELINLVKGNLPAFEKLAREERKYSSAKYNDLKRLTVDGYIKQEYSKGLYKYMQQRFKGRNGATDRLIKNICGRLLFVFGFINPPPNISRDKTLLRYKDKSTVQDKHFISNFEKYL